MDCIVAAELHLEVVCLVSRLITRSAVAVRNAVAGVTNVAGGPHRKRITVLVEAGGRVH